MEGSAANDRRTTGRGSVHAQTPCPPNLAPVVTFRLSSGVHFMQVSKWLGHSTFTLTLDIYGDYIPKDDGGAVNPLPEPTAPAKQAELPSNVVPLFGQRAN